MRRRKKKARAIPGFNSTLMGQVPSLFSQDTPSFSRASFKDRIDEDSGDVWDDDWSEFLEGPSFTTQPSTRVGDDTTDSASNLALSQEAGSSKKVERPLLDVSVFRLSQGSRPASQDYRFNGAQTVDVLSNYRDQEAKETTERREEFFTAELLDSNEENLTMPSGSSK